MKRIVWLLAILLMTPALAQAWWNNDWGYRKKITIDAQKLQQNGIKIPVAGLALVGLHSANFEFFDDLGDGKTLRFIAADDKTPLKFYIEKIDAVNQIAFIWVKLPNDLVTAQEPSFWMYYGNAKPEGTPDGDASAAFSIFDANQILDYHFDVMPTIDATANNIQPAAATNSSLEAGAIGNAGGFDGSQQVRIAATPAIPMQTNNGWTLSMWVKIDQSQNDGVVFHRDKLSILIRGQAPVLELGGKDKELVSPAGLNLASWHHLAVNAGSNGFTLFVDGKAAGILSGGDIAALEGDLSIGSSVFGARGFIGAIDEVGLTKTTLDNNALQFAALMQGQNSELLTYGKDETPDDSGEKSVIVATLENVTVDGWVIIGILAVMFLISWLVMIAKAIVLAKVMRENKKFEAAFVQLGAKDLSKLDHPDEPGQEDYNESPLLLSLTGNHAEFTGSSIYRLYHIGVQEINKRIPKGVGYVAAEQVLSAPALNAIKASMDGTMVRELQKLNSQMVLLTIAISGGPFLGLLGTVVGVMITFAEIAIQGEVNVNAIAPGIAAALAATIAGLAVAIPALFGYNYLGSQIKMITADMQVFVDEFIAKIAEQHS